MRKLFTIPLLGIAWVYCGRLLQPYTIVVANSSFLQNFVLNLANTCNFKPEINISLNSFKFFIHFATYQKVNPLLLTYSAEITHTYNQTLTASFNFSHPADVLPSVLFGNFPKLIAITNGSCNAYYSVMDRG